MSNEEELWIGPTKCDEKRILREEELTRVWKIVKEMLEEPNFINSTYYVVSLPLNLLREAQNCYQNGAYLATCSMCRSSIEALLYFVASRKPVDSFKADIDLNYVNKKRNEFLNKVLEKGLLNTDDEKIIKEIWKVGDFAMHIHQIIEREQIKLATQVFQESKINDDSLKGWSSRSEALKILNETAGLISKVMKKMNISLGLK